MKQDEANISQIHIPVEFIIWVQIDITEAECASKVK